MVNFKKGKHNRSVMVAMQGPDMPPSYANKFAIRRMMNTDGIKRVICLTYRLIFVIV
jgi:hypothetical protein